MKYAEKREIDPLKIAAYNAVNLAIKNGEIAPQACEKCGSIPADAHHDDYSKPLDLRWLCRSHHREIHGRNKRGRT